MFSFIKFLQGLKEKFQKNKGLWFTTMTVLSILGIVITMYIITTMTSNVTIKVHQSMAKGYNLQITNIIDSKEEEFKKMAAVLTQDIELTKVIEENKIEELNVITKNINDQFVKDGIPNYIVSFYTLDTENVVLRPSVISVIKSKNTVYGIEVMADGVYNTYLKPLIKGENVYGVIEVKESINNLKKYFEGINSEYAFLLDKKMLSQISIQTKNGRYRDIINDYTVDQSAYDTKFLATIPEIKKEKFKEMLTNGYIIENSYYRTHKIINDINGAEIGIMIVGEYDNHVDGFVHLADNMTKTVTTVALGLVISIMLFMF